MRGEYGQEFNEKNSSGTNNGFISYCFGSVNHSPNIEITIATIDNIADVNIGNQK